MVKLSPTTCYLSRSLVVRWVVGSIPHGGSIEILLDLASAPRLVNRSRGMCYPVCVIVLIKEPLLLLGKSSPCGGRRFPLSLSEWPFTICLTPYNSK